MKSVEVEVFSVDGSPVVRMPGRRFPGVVIQGDSLSTLVSQAHVLLEVLTEAKLPTAADEAREMHTYLAELLQHYAATLVENEIPLPYEPSVATTIDQPLRVMGWVPEQQGRRFLEIVSSFVEYTFDADDWRVMTTQLERKSESSARYAIPGNFDLTVDLALADDGGHLLVRLSGDANPYLQIQLETLLVALTHPA